MEKFTAVIFLILVSCSTIAQSQTCKHSCGYKYSNCSCHMTCTPLGNCCEDYKEFCVDLLPYSGSMMGGRDITILHATFNQSEKITCTFDVGNFYDGYVDENGRAHCISPLLYKTGWVSMQARGASGTRMGFWLSVHTGKLDAKYKAVLVNSTLWQYYGTPGYGGVLEMTWDKSLVRAERVNIELWGYRETGEPYSYGWKAEWVYLYSLARNQSNNGSFSFLPKPSEKFSNWELGAIRVGSSVHTDGASNINSVWTEDHALAWHLDQKFRDDSAAWALDKCLAWDQLETKLPNFLDEIIDCPCTLAQARADTGRFHTDYGCDIEKGSVCTYHPGCVHCVRAIEASPRYKAGQQCCYDSTGAQVLTGDSMGGSTPDRAHDWGAPPYEKPPRIPGQSHWLYDVLSFYYCCLWSDNCQYYFKHRPSSDCKRYQAPRSAVVFGDPHFITFDGVSYSFNGKGEYTLLHSKTKELTIQGRTEPVNGTIKATKLTSVVMREKKSNVIEVRLVKGVEGLQVVKNQLIMSFTEQSWMDLTGAYVFSPTPSNVTVMFPSGAGVELRRRGETMMATVLLPDTFTGQTEGLLGKMDGKTEGDLVLSNGLPVRNISNPEEVFSFGASWAVSNRTALFTYDSQYLLETYNYLPRHDIHFMPDFSAPESPDDPLSSQAAEICTGEGSQFCRYDIIVGRSPAMGNYTKEAYQSHVSLVKDLRQVVGCGYLPAPANGNKTGNKYTEGSKVEISCNDGYNLKGSTIRVCQLTGEWSGEPTTCKPPTDNTAGIIAGSVIGAIALIVIIVTIVVVVRKKQKRKKTQKESKAQSF